MDLSLLAALIALCILIVDPLVARWNKALYRRDKGKQGADRRFKDAMKRRNLYKTSALLFLIIASLLQIYSTRKETEMSEQERGELSKSLAQINRAITGVDARTARIEQFLWGRGGKGEDTPDQPRGPTSGPDSGAAALTIDERLQRMERDLQNLSGRAVTREELEELHEEIIELKKALAEHQEMMVRITGLPAG